MSFTVVDVQIEPTYAVKVVVDMSNVINWPEADEGYANDAWVNDRGAIAIFGIAGSNFGTAGTKVRWHLASSLGGLRLRHLIRSSSHVHWLPAGAADRFLYQRRPRWSF